MESRTQEWNSNDPIRLGSGGLTFGETYCELQGGYFGIPKPALGWTPMTFQIVCQTDETTDPSTTHMPYMPTVAGVGSARSFHWSSQR